MKDDLDTTDPTFPEDLDKSYTAVQAVARYYHRRGFNTMLPRKRTRKNAAQRAGYSDEGDLFVMRGVEVKERSLSFTSLEAFPYPTVIVDRCHSYDSKKPKPDFYYIVNREHTHAIVIRTGTDAAWTRGKGQDGRVEREMEWYYCPTELCFMVDLRGGDENG